MGTFMALTLICHGSISVSKCREHQLSNPTSILKNGTIVLFSSNCPEVMDMKKLLILICFLFGLSISCATPRSALMQVSLGMTKEEVIKSIGEPELRRGAITNKFGEVVEVWEYRVLGKGKLLDIMQWDADDYWFYFVESKLVQWGKAGDWRREADRIYEIRFDTQKPKIER